MNETNSITVTISDRTYPLKVKTGDEAIVKMAEHLINEKFHQFQLKFSGQEPRDYLAMSALMNMVELLKKGSDSEGSVQELMNKLVLAEGLVTEALGK